METLKNKQFYVKNLIYKCRYMYTSLMALSDIIVDK